MSNDSVGAVGYIRLSDPAMFTRYAGPVHLCSVASDAFFAAYDLVTRGAADDTQLVAQLRAGAHDAAAGLLDRYGSDLKALAYSVVRDDDIAEDVVAETLLKAWRGIGSLRDPERLRPWLLTITTREALRHLRTRRTSPLAIAEWDVPVGGQEDGFESTTATRLDVGDAMERLPPRMRAVIALRYLFGLSVDEIGRVLGRSRNTIKTELRLGLRRLRAEIPNP